MKRLLQSVSIGIFCATAWSLGQAQLAYSAPTGKPTQEEKTLEKDIQQEKKQIKKDIQQVHKDMVKKDDESRLPADEATLAQDQSELQVLETELQTLLASSSK